VEGAHEEFKSLGVEPSISKDDNKTSVIGLPEVNRSIFGIKKQNGTAKQLWWAA
jgi:hypothetical protein